MKFKIYKPAKSSMQSGKKNKKWLLAPIEEINHRSSNPLMGWTSSNNTQTQLKIAFASKEAAIEYATKNNLSFEIEEESIFAVKPKSYAQNFTS